MEQYGYLTFKSVSYAMKFETGIKNHNVKIKIIPVPRAISSSCGFCVRFDLSDIENIKTISSQNNLEYDKLYTALS